MTGNREILRVEKLQGPDAKNGKGRRRGGEKDGNRAREKHKASSSTKRRKSVKDLYYR